MMTWKIPDEAYLDYLRNNFDTRIPNCNYGPDKFKPFFGSLFTVGEMVYITQISHPQQRHEKIKENVDFFKLYYPKTNDLLAVINLNYMFPIHGSLLVDLEYRDIEKYRVFKDLDQKSKYIDLLRMEIAEINDRPICESAEKVYQIKSRYPDSFLAKRCLDFSSLETAWRQYEK